MIRPLFPSLLATALLLSGQVQQQALAEGFGDFSVPPPKPVPKPKPAPRAHKPGHGRSTHKPRPAPAASPSETLKWTSGEMLCNGKGQLCSERASWSLQTEHDADYFLQTRVPSRYCSPLTMEIALDDQLLGPTGPSGPGQVGVYRLGHIGPGSHRIEIWAIGRDGGCNDGRLGSWGVDLVLSSDPGYRAEAVELSAGR